MSQYQRTLPRDLFNESKLLKCIGRLVICIEDGQIPGLKYDFNDDDNSSFNITQDPDTGNLRVTNVTFFDCYGKNVDVFTLYNSKDNYPLIISYKGNEYFIFNENGEVQISLNLFL